MTKTIYDYRTEFSKILSDREPNFYSEVHKTIKGISRPLSIEYFDSSSSSFDSNIPMLPHDVREMIVKIFYEQNIKIIDTPEYTITTFQGLPHSFDDNPAIVIKNNTNISSEEWYNYGLLHRKYGPSYINYYSNAKMLLYHKNGKLHQDTDRPSVIYIYNSGKN